MRFLVVLNGSKPDEKLLREQYKQSDVVLCADGGGAYIHDLGLQIDFLMGDMDSIDANKRREIEARGTVLVTHPMKKDETDAQLALDYAVEHGATEIIIMGAEGGRSDHFFANLMLLRRMAWQGIDTRMMIDGGDVRCCQGVVELQGTPGDIVSVLPFSDGMAVAWVEGLLYPITLPTELPMDTPLGISNQMIKDTAAINIISGWALVFHYHQGGNL